MGIVHLSDRRPISGIEPSALSYKFASLPLGHPVPTVDIAGESSKCTLQHLYGKLGEY